MNKLCRLLAIFSLLVAAGGCRPNEATQTVVEVRPDPTMKELVSLVQVQAYALRSDADPVLVREDPAAPVVWPVRRTFTPSSASSSHRFRLVVTAFDDANTEVANVTFEGEVIDGATRYVLVRLGDMCRPSKCKANVCEARVDADDLANSPQEAFCRDNSTEPDTATVSGAGGDMTTAGRPGSSAQAGTMGTSPASSSTNNTPAANGGTGMQTSGQTTHDAGVAVPPPPPSTEGECQKEPCGAHGYCGASMDPSKKYVCVCETGYEPDETATTCVERDDCKKSNGGCKGRCETVPGTGEAKCSCEGNTWLKSDGKQCAELQPEEVLSLGGRSVQRTRPQVAFDTAGNGVVAWTETADDGNHSLWSARYSAETKSWDKPSGPFLPGSTNAADLHLALDASGSGMLLWTATVGAHRQLWSVRYRENAFSLAELRRIDDASDSDALMPALALDEAGDALIAWTDTIFPKSSLRIARYSASRNAFTTMATVLGATSQSLVANTSVALHSEDSGLVAWTDVPVSTPDGGMVEVGRAVAFNAKVGPDLGRRGVFDDGLAASTSPDVAVDAQGRGVAVWLRANAASSGSYTLLSGAYMSGADWGSANPQVLADNVSALSAPHIAVGAESAFAVWRTLIGSDANAKSLTRGALSLGNGFEPAQDIGFMSDAVMWGDIDTMNWTLQTTVTQIDAWQPHWDLAVGPNQTGFVVGAAFDSSVTPAQRQLWLQHVSSTQETARPIRFTSADSVPARSSVPKIGLNANGDGAVVWDRQVAGHFEVVVSLLQ